MSATAPTPPTPRITVTSLAAMKAAERPIVMVTAYDVAGARLADAAGVDAILVGDSLGMTVLGYDSTLPVTMDDMLRATAAVVRGTRRALVVADMPFGSYQASADDAVGNAGRLLAEAGAAAVKLEGTDPHALEVTRRLVGAGIPVMGHVGLTPQSFNALGGYRVQAKEAAPALALLDGCRALQEAGAFAIVLECIPAELAALVSAELHIATIGIGAGAGCDGQVQVFHDILGMGGDFTPRHAKRFAEIGEAVRVAIAAYGDDVRDGEFPGEPQTTHMAPETLAEVKRAMKRGLRKVAGGEV